MAEFKDQEEVVLLDFWPSMYGMRVRIALAEKGIKYVYKEQDLINKGAELLEMNPVHKKVPVLIHRGKPICESLIILEYIEEVWKGNGASLLPSDPYQRAHARFWANFIDQKLYGVGKNIWSTKEDEKEAAKKVFIETLKVLEEELGEKAYFGGDTFGFIDISFITFYSWFHAYETFGEFSVEAECPKIIIWVKRCLHRESVSKSLPDHNKILGFVVEIRKKFGLE